MCCTQDFIKGIISTFDMSTFTCDQILDDVRKSGFFTSDEIFIMLGNLIKEKDKAYEAKFNSLRKAIRIKGFLSFCGSRVNTYLSIHA